jgi:hypothetical protein
MNLDSGPERTAFLVNISVLGAYVAEDAQPPLGARGQCRFHFPGNALEVSLPCIVAWVNPKQQHPIHSLPPGYGLKFVDLTKESVVRIEAFVAEQVGRGRTLD